MSYQLAYNYILFSTYWLIEYGLAIVASVAFNSNVFFFAGLVKLACIYSEFVIFVPRYSITVS